jgi:hypothetical protein
VRELRERQVTRAALLLKTIDADGPAELACSSNPSSGRFKCSPGPFGGAFPLAVLAVPICARVPAKEGQHWIPVALYLSPTPRPAADKADASSQAVGFLSPIPGEGELAQVGEEKEHETAH